jgi:threonine dehydrogenase-like Zn-dependent dehydrogenase
MLIHKAILHGRGDLRLEETVPPDELGPNELLIETEVTAFSTGTDLGNYLGDSSYVPGAPGYPRAVGYSNAGRVRALGSNVKSLQVCDRVFSTRPHQSAYVAKEDDLLVRIPQSVTSEEASLAYLAQLGLAALRQASYQSGENVLVVGLGVIGLCTMALTKAMGANTIGVANSEFRCKAAKKLGVLDCLLTEDPNLALSLERIFGRVGADLVILTSNSWSSYFQSLELARVGGRVSILGFPGRTEPPSQRNPLEPALFYSKQLTLLGAGVSPQVECTPHEIRFNLRRNLEYILSLMASRRLLLSPLISHHLPWKEMQTAYDLAAQRSKNFVAAVFDWRMR